MGVSCAKPEPELYPKDSGKPVVVFSWAGDITETSAISTQSDRPNL